jgi:hypothetical protein|tara:strand:- start:31 stop:447 length:417 start_codon:yes stop_codon:yes gene_type:complete
MIKYNLTCKCGKTFGSWFSNSSEYDGLKRKKLLTCIYCNSKSVKKSIMAPNLYGKSKESFKENKKAKNLRKQLLEFKKYLEKNCENVGENFAQEARNIHYDNKTSKGIYGKATTAETSELLEEGIDVMTIPWIKKSEN